MTLVERLVSGQVSQTQTSLVMIGKSSGISGLVVVGSWRTLSASARFQTAVSLPPGSYCAAARLTGAATAGGATRPVPPTSMTATSAVNARRAFRLMFKRASRLLVGAVSDPG